MGEGRRVPSHGSGPAGLPDHPNDLCYCGDYRHQHKDGQGACALNALGHGYGGGSCHSFRLTRRAALTQPEAPDHG